MPCEPDAFVDILMRAETLGNHEYYADPQPANEWGWGIRQSNTEIIGWRYASSDQPKAEPTELERLREENAQLREAIKEAHETLNLEVLWAFDHAEPPYELQASWLNGKGSLTSGPNNCRRFHAERQTALAKLQPFIKP